MGLVRQPPGRSTRRRRAIAVAFFTVASIALACGDGEQAGTPQPTMKVAPLPDSAGWSHLTLSADSFCVDAIPPLQCRSFRIGGVAYTVTAEGDARTLNYGLHSFTQGVRQLRIYDDSARLVYAEAIRAAFADSAVERVRRTELVDDPREPTNWVEAEVRGLEDSAGVPRAFLITFTAHLSRETVPDVYHRIVAPRGGRLEVLVPKLTHLKDPERRRENSWGGTVRLAEGDRIVLERWRGYFEAFVPYHVDFRCTPGAERCLTPALRDSIDGFARFDVDAEWRLTYSPARESGETGTIEIFASPAAEKGERVTISPADVRVLGGAGRIRFGAGPGDSTAGDVTTDDWLHIRLASGRTGWIHGNDDFTAIGLQRGVRPTPGSAIPEPPPRTEMN